MTRKPFIILSAILCLSILSLYLSSSLFAEENESVDKGKSLKEEKKKDEEVRKKDIFHPHEEIIVTATATRKFVKDCSASVSVVRDEDLRATPATNAMNILNFLPGLFVQKTGDFGRADLEIRGIGGNGRRINILVDGRPEKMGLFACAVTHAFPLDNVERIEVVRGPSSTLYGSEALGGVVNIITHKPQKSLETEFFASYGSFDTRQLNLRQGGKVKKFGFYLTLDERKSDGHLPNSDYHGRAFTGKILYELSENLELSFQGKYFHGKKYESGPINLPLNDFWNDYERGAFDLTLNRSSEKRDLFLKLYRDFGHHEFSDGWHSRDFVQGGIFRYTSRWMANNEFSVGGDFRQLGGKSYNFPRGEWKKSEAALFLQDEHVLKERLILSAGFRVNNDSVYGLEWCPYSGLVLRIDDKTNLRASLSKGFRSPQLNELYIFPSSNPELNPERVWSYEAGIQRQLGRRVNLGATFYRLEGRNLIELASNPVPPPKFKFFNVGKFTFKGMEMNLEAFLSPRFSLLAFFTYLDPGTRTKGRPGQKWDFSLRFKNERLFASLQGQYVRDYYAEDFSKFELPSFFLLNSRIEYEIFSHLYFFTEIQNILDEDYRIYVEMPGVAAGIYPMPGRSFNLGVRVRL